jgi:hypothetical protein
MLRLVQVVAGAIGETIIYALIFLFGRRRDPTTIGWLAGPLGGPRIGDRSYEETALAEGLGLERDCRDGGLLPDFAALAGPGFDPARVDPRIRDFYENTSAYRLDTWATTYFPARIALWLLVTTISRRVEQLNFPIDGLETARGMRSEIVRLRRPDGSIRYTGWFRTLMGTGRVIYTGYYMTESPPRAGGPCVKVVFPMPDGNATVLLRPTNIEGSGFRLASIGHGFGDAGFYRVQRAGHALRVWCIRTLHETFRLYVDPEDFVRCEHDVRFLGFPVLTLHYRIMPAMASASRETAPVPAGSTAPAS